MKNTSDARMTNFRWIICGMLFFATTVNYLDRQVLSLTWKDFIAPEFHWTDANYGLITGVFSLVYAVANIFAGRFVDWMSTRKGYLWAIGVWSVGACLHAFCGVATELTLGLDSAREMGEVFVRVEPMGPSEQAEKGAREALEKLGYRRVEHMLPEDTWRLNLTCGRDALLKGMDKSTRKRYRQAEGKGIEIRTSTDPEDIPLLTKLMSEVEDRNGVVLRDTEYLKEEAAALFPTGNGRLYLAVAHEADDEGKPTGKEAVVAANFVFLDDDCCYLIHNGSDSNYFKTGANVAMQVQIVLDAQAEGRTWCDFHGMAPEGAGPEHPWYGFT